MAVKKKPHSCKPGSTLPTDKCNARLRGERAGRLCGRSAGKGTDHPGQGRCYQHGGATPIKHGRYSMITRPALRDLVAQFEADPDPLNLEPELALLKAFAVEAIERPGNSKDPTAAADLLERAARTAERIKRMDNLTGISMAEYLRAMGEVGRVIDALVKDETLHEQLTNAILSIRVSS